LIAEGSQKLASVPSGGAAAGGAAAAAGAAAGGAAAPAEEEKPAEKEEEVRVPYAYNAVNVSLTPSCRSPTRTWASVFSTKRLVYRNKTTQKFVGVTGHPLNFDRIMFASLFV
jgi:hypothetical protein